jgi:hypothetical protein
MSEPSKLAVEVIAHPPERGSRGSVILPCACCSCCCCCLHSVGSLAGGILGSLKKQERLTRPVDPDFPFPFRRDELEEEGPLLPVMALYWLLVLFQLGVGAIWGFLASGGRRPSDLLAGLIIGLAVLPAIQLGASLVSLFVVLLFYTDRANSLQRLASITAYSFFGTLVGIGLMFCICVPYMMH